MAATKRMTKAQIIGELAEKTGLTKREVASVFEGMRELIKRELGKRGPKEFVVPDLIKLKLNGLADGGHGLLDQRVSLIEFLCQLIKLADHGFTCQVSLFLDGKLGILEILVDGFLRGFKLLIQLLSLFFNVGLDLLNLVIKALADGFKALLCFVGHLTGLFVHLVTGTADGRLHAMFHGFNRAFDVVLHRLGSFSEQLTGLVYR